MVKQSWVWATLTSPGETFALLYAFSAATLVCFQSARCSPGKLTERLVRAHLGSAPQIDEGLVVYLFAISSVVMMQAAAPSVIGQQS